MSRRTEDITRSTTANIYICISNLVEITLELFTNIQELNMKLFKFQINQEKANTKFLTILNKIQNQIKKLENSKYSTELDHKLSQMANTISEKITKDVEVIASDITRFMNEVVNKAFEKVLDEINKKSSEKALNKHLDWAKNKQKRKLSISKDIGHEYVYNLEETSAIHIIEQIDHAIKVDESGKRISSQVQPDECICINQENECYFSLAIEIPKFKINKLPTWSVR
ncbi:15972_t:CDS:2 [Gigaspora margarita]|uniref:15972_t:CDS:1 n=1 Tax=Gigaspora margarita TaxID=4874 RepID=A0ABN7V4S2_GIGMA|nr:15972_t:CDS:2 [Gigaspora margarita]